MAAATIFSTMKELFKLDNVTGMASVELWVVMATLLLVVRFLIDSFGWRVYSSRFMTATVQILALLSYSLVQYTMGLMQLSAPRVNDYFQVWAVLLVSLQYSVKVGLPYSRSKEVPLLELMSSFWAANLIRVQTTYLRIPLWFIWALNAARIISYFFSSDKAEAGIQENTRRVADYMRQEHKHTTLADTTTMKGYNYLVHGEDLVTQEILQQGRRTGQARYRLHLSPQHEKLITIEKIWDVDGGESGLLSTAADPGNQLKDVCLSFALHKLLRRRFHDLPLHEANIPAARDKMRRLVFEYILQGVDNYERAFRIMEVELSFLQDTLYIRHASTFAEGLPLMRMLLTLLLIVATGYITYPVRCIPQSIDLEDKNQITHGVFVTLFIICLIIAKELWEIYIYAFTPRTKVQMICMYVEHQCLRRPLVKKAMRLVFCLITRAKWNHQICQYNLLISSRKIMFKSTSVRLRGEVQKAIFDSFKGLQQDQQRLESYLSNAFGSNQPLFRQLVWTDELEADTHKILVWHIATSLCEINLLGEADAKEMKVSSLRSRPLIKEKREPGDVWEHYITAISLSNYCMNLIRKALVPDNGLVVERVFREVRRETRRATHKSKTFQDTYNKLMKIARDPVENFEQVSNEANEEEYQGDNAANRDVEEQMIQEEENKDSDERSNGHGFKVNIKVPERDDEGFENTILRMGSELGIQLIETYTDNELVRVGLWRDLANFWTGFLLHLAASTRAGKHKMHLATRGELVTHLWALLSHAGYLGNVNHGEQLLDKEDLEDDNPLN